MQHCILKFLEALKLFYFRDNCGNVKCIIDFFSNFLEKKHFDTTQRGTLFNKVFQLYYVFVNLTFTMLNYAKFQNPNCHFFYSYSSVLRYIITFLQLNITIYYTHFYTKNLKLSMSKITKIQNFDFFFQF